MSNLAQFIGGGTPIGSLVPFQDTAPNSLSIAGQTFLRSGVTALASAYPLAPLTTLMPGTTIGRTHPDVFSSVAWSPSLSLFVATSAFSTGSIYSSPDGITWTARQTVSVTQACVYWTGTLFISFPAGSGTQAYSSSNGTSWTPFSLPAISGGGGLQQICQVGTNIVVNPGPSASTTWYSTNSGSTWTTGTLPATGGTIVASSTTFLFVNGSGSNGTVSSNNGASFAGATSWSSSGSMTNFRSDGTYIYGENVSGTPVATIPPGISRTQDGVTWTNVGSRNSIAFPTTGVQCQYVGGIFLWSTGAGVLKMSSDGINGKNAPSPALPVQLTGSSSTPTNTGSFAYGNSTLVCACGSGTQGINYGAIATYIDNTISSSPASGSINYMRVA